MADLLRFVLVLFFIAILVFLEGTRFLSISGVVPNLFLVFFLGLFFAPALSERIQFDYFFILLSFYFFVGSFFFGFWMVEWALIAALAILIYFLRNFLTGRPLPDFLVSIAIGTAVFYVLIELLVGGAFAWNLMFKEVFYNFILGMLFWILMAKTRLIFRKN